MVWVAGVRETIDRNTTVHALRTSWSRYLLGKKQLFGLFHVKPPCVVATFHVKHRPADEPGLLLNPARPAFLLSVDQCPADTDRFT